MTFSEIGPKFSKSYKIPNVLNVEYYTKLPTNLGFNDPYTEPQTVSVSVYTALKTFSLQQLYGTEKDCGHNEYTNQLPGDIYDIYAVEI
jgi:hypothetical protein